MWQFHPAEVSIDHLMKLLYLMYINQHAAEQKAALQSHQQGCARQQQAFYAAICFASAAHSGQSVSHYSISPACYLRDNGYCYEAERHSSTYVTDIVTPHGSSR